MRLKQINCEVISLKDYSIFEIIGPVMIGPSSSHTAGAVRLGYMARKIAGEEIAAADFYLHGSFAKTYVGHGTDRALLAGVMGFLPDDERIRDAAMIAAEKGLAYRFLEIDLGDVHPNSVKMVLRTVSGEICQVTGSSIGGGKVQIININGTDVDFAGEYTTLITQHLDRPGVLAGISAILARYQINIAFMKLFRETKAGTAVLVAETDQEISREAVAEIKSNPLVYQAKVLEPF